MPPIVKNEICGVCKKVLLTVNYINSKSSTITTGLRDFNITVADDEPRNSSGVSVRVTVKDRNDPPEINLGAGYGVSDAITFHEEHTGIDFVTKPYLIEFRDEETTRLSKATITLRQGISRKITRNDPLFLYRSEPAGHLDDGDYLYSLVSNPLLTFEASSVPGSTYTLTFTGEASYDVNVVLQWLFIRLEFEFILELLRSSGRNSLHKHRKRADQIRW